MANSKDIQRRIKSIGNTKKITRAMEMVAASKMRKAVDATLATRSYANLSWETLLNLTRGSAGATHPLLENRTQIKRQALIVITSDRGLCGGFNSSLLSLVRQSDVSIPTDIILIGKKGENLSAHYTIAAQFPYPETGLDSAAVLPIARLASDGFLSGKYDRVLVAYTDFVNAAKQTPRLKQLLPVVADSEDKELGIIDSEDRVGSSQSFIEAKAAKHSQRGLYNFEYLFEPGAEVVLAAVVPRLLEIQLYQALLESLASEHSARMAAMHQATQAATDLGIELTLSYNKARQSAITAEIAEITAGVAALN